MTTIQVMTQNVFTDLELSLERINLLIDSLCNHSPDIFCLQEAALKQHRAALSSNNIEQQYYILCSNRFNVQYRFKSYIPMIFFLTIAISLGLARHGQLSFICTVLILLAVIVYPPVFIQVMSCFSPVAKQMANHELDRQGLVIGINKSLRDKQPNILKAEPFATLGYEFLFNELLGWVVRWVQYTYLRPGYMIVECGDLLIVNAHFATGVVNQTRMQQVKELDDIINGIVMEKQDTISRIFFCCDSNAHCDQPEMMYIERHMQFVDCWKHCNPDKDGFTWSKANELVNDGKFSDEPNQRVDYIWYKEQNTNNETKYNVNNTDLIATSKPYLSDHFGVLTTFLLESDNM
eukprot:180108_1